MKRLITILLVFVLLVVEANASTTRVFKLTLQNKAKYTVVEKSITIARKSIEVVVGELDEGSYAWLRTETMAPVIAQLDDLDGDGKWDELYTLVSFRAKESKTFTVELLKNRPFTEQRTNIRFADINDASKEYRTAVRLTSNTTEISQQHFQFEGPGWENDVIAFRNYFDARNGIDIFGKLTTEMVLDSCGLKNGPSYHNLQPWGMDILKVANSLGAGAIALKTKNGLYRLGENGTGTYKLIVEGPIRSIFDLIFEGVNIEGQLISLKHRISIDAGKPFYKSEVFVTGGKGIEVVSGIVNLHSKEFFTAKSKLFSAFYTHDYQAYDGELLGMAIFVPQKKLSVNTAPEEGEGITQTYYVSVPVKSSACTFYFMAGWELQNNQYKLLKGFGAEVNNQLAQLESAVNVSINK